MKQIIEAELQQIESEIIRTEAQMFEMDKHLTSLMGRRSSLLTVIEKIVPEPVIET